MTIVDSDTSPIRALNHLECVGILGQLFDQVLIPPAVLLELTQPQPRFPPVNVSVYTFMDVRGPRDLAQVRRFLTALDAGESEALTLAMEIGAEALLVDERACRSVAAAHGMAVIGTLGILSRAKTRGYIGKVRPLLDSLKTELDFFISDELCARFLRGIGE